MQIEFKDEYNQITNYFGVLKLPERSDGWECRFTVEVLYFNNKGNLTINKITWEGDELIPEGKKDKAEQRISDMVKEWHGKRCDIGISIELGDKNA